MPTVARHRLATPDVIKDSSHALGGKHKMPRLAYSGIFF